MIIILLWCKLFDLQGSVTWNVCLFMLMAQEEFFCHTHALSNANVCRQISVSLKENVPFSGTLFKWKWGYSNNLTKS